MTTETMTSGAPHTPGSPPKRSLDTIALAVGLLLAAGMLAWLFLGSGESSQPLQSMPAIKTTRPAVEAEPGATGDVTDAVISTDESVGSLIDRARLAADAGMLAEPAGNNALYYYSLALDAEPENETALAEMDVAIGDVALQISALIQSGDWVAASAIADELAVIRGEHPVLGDLRDAIAADFDTRIATAEAAAADGRFDAAFATLDESAVLPGMDPQRIEAVRATIQAQAAARRAEAERAAAEAARASGPEPVAPAKGQPVEQAAAKADEPGLAERIRQSISLGRLTPPATNNAASLLVQMRERQPDSAELAEIETEFSVALASAVRLAIAESDLDRAERMMVRWSQLGLPEDTAAALQVEVDQAFIARETAAVISAATLRRTKTVAPVYPRSAVRRNLEGEVALEYTVDATGKTRDIIVTNSTAGTVFDRSAIRAVSQWEYEPRELRGRAVPQRVYARVNYSLE